MNEAETRAEHIDPGFIPIFERTGHALETAVLLELQRRGCSLHYVRTPAGYEDDFHAVDVEGGEWLVQVCATASDPATFERETRALKEAASIYPRARPFLLLLEPAVSPTTDSLEIVPALPWFLQPASAPLLS